MPSHVQTWAYDDGCNGGAGASSALVREWVTYAESNCGPVGTDSKVLRDCHAGGVAYCTALAYLNSNDIYSDSVPIAADAQESWWLHQPGGTDATHRLINSDDWGQANLINQFNGTAEAWFQNYVRNNFTSFDGLMMDGIAGSTTAQFYGTGYTSSNEISTNSGILSEHEQMAAAMTRADGSQFIQVDNGINVNPYVPTTFPLLNNPSKVTGLIAEGDPYENGTLTNFYSTLLDDTSYVDAQANDFLVLLSYDNSGSLRARRIQAATVLLGFSPGHTVSWSDLEQSSNNLAVWPEEGIYPTQPVQSMSPPSGAGCLSGAGQVCSHGGHVDVQVAPGVYRREFKSCYNHGATIGPCAAIVNDTSNAVTIQPRWLTQTYKHQITMIGGDVQSGGSINVTGASFQRGSTAIPAKDALLLSS